MKMTWIALVGFVVFSETARARELPPLAIGQGEQRVLHIPGLVKYTLGSEAVRAFTPRTPSERSPDVLLLKGVSPGQADLWVWLSDGSSDHRSIRVARLAPQDLPEGLARALGQVEQCEVIYTGTGATLRGEIRDVDELSRIRVLADAFPKSVTDLTVPSDELLAKSEARLRGWLDHSNFKSRMRIERIERSLWLRGSLENPAERGELERQARALFPPLNFEISALADASPTIHFKVFLLELKRSRFGALGLTWPASQDGAVHVTGDAVTGLLDLQLTLQALEGDGSARILSNPELVVRAPGEAELFSGGELPIHFVNHFQSSTTWKTYGLTLQLKVQQSTAEKVRLDIVTEVSHLDYSTASDDHVPGLQANRMRTQVDARFGAPLLLSGLLQQGMREEARGLPWLRDIPVLGKLFGSEDYLNERSELVAILLPSAAPPLPSPATLAKFNELAEDEPHGPAPLPRNWVSPARARELKNSPEYPWNAL